MGFKNNNATVKKNFTNFMNLINFTNCFLSSIISHAFTLNFHNTLYISAFILA